MAEKKLNPEEWTRAFDSGKGERDVVSNSNSENPEVEDDGDEEIDELLPDEDEATKDEEIEVDEETGELENAEEDVDEESFDKK